MKTNKNTVLHDIEEYEGYDEYLTSFAEKYSQDDMDNWFADQWEWRQKRL